MKKSNLLLILLTCFIVCCSKDDSPEVTLTVSEFFNYCANGNNECRVPLNHEGENVSIIGYVHVLNTFEDDNRFQLFDSSSMESHRIDISVVNNETDIFNKIDQNIDLEDYTIFTKFKVTGKIVGHDMPINDNCIRGGNLELDNSKNIIVME
jgi:hypothetical protein